MRSAADGAQSVSESSSVNEPFTNKTSLSPGLDASTCLDASSTLSLDASLDASLDTSLDGLDAA